MSIFDLLRRHLPEDLRKGLRRLLRRKSFRRFPPPVVQDGKYYYHQILHLGEKTGCSVTSLAMLLSNLCQAPITPVEVFRANDCSCYMVWVPVMQHFGFAPVFTSLERESDKLARIRELLAKHPEGVILHIPPAEEPGHFFVVYGAGSLPGELMIADPMGDGQNAQQGPIPLRASYTWSRFGESWLSRVSTAVTAGSLIPAVLPPEEGKEALPRALLCSTGDILIHQAVIDAAETENRFDFHPMFCYLRPYLAAADFAVADLETTLCGNDAGYDYSGYPCFNSPDALIPALRDSGFDLLLTANNHAYDTGEVGFRRTIRVVREHGLQALGTRLSERESEYRIVEINGIRIGMLCYTYETDGGSPDAPALNGLRMPPGSRALINTFDPEHPEALYQGVSQASERMRAEGAEVVLLYLHWGIEYQRHPSRIQQSIAQQLCDLGVDVIIGGHPHVLQPIEQLQSRTNPEHRTLCLYSMGNALSNQRFRKRHPLSSPFREDGGLFYLSFVRDPERGVRLESARLLPTWVLLRKGERRVYRVLPLDRKAAHWASRFSLRPKELLFAKLSYLRTRSMFRSWL